RAPTLTLSPRMSRRPSRPDALPIFGDVQSLEWQTEKRPGSEAPAPGHSGQVDDYRVELELQGESAQLAVWRDEKPLKSIPAAVRSEEHTSELQSRENLVCRLLLAKK